MNRFLHIMMALSVLGIATLSAPAEASAKGLTVEIRSIAASTSGPQKVDPKLNDLKRKLQSKSFSGYKNFRQIRSQSITLPEGRPRSIRLPNGTTMTLTYHGFSGKLAKLELDIKGKMNTTLRASPGSTFFQAGLRHGKDTLILAIRVR